MKLRNYLSGTNGLTIIEVLLSLTILGIIVLGVMQFFTQAYSFTNSNQNKTVAINVARNAMMYMEKQNFIETRENFKNHASASLFICHDKYQLVWSKETKTAGCTPISINNIDYNVTITSTDEDNQSFMIPLAVKVGWEVNKKPDSTELKGALKSEDIR